MGKCHGSAMIPHYIERKNAVRVTVFRYIFLKKRTIQQTESQFATTICTLSDEKRHTRKFHTESFEVRKQINTFAG